MQLIPGLGIGGTGGGNAPGGGQLDNPIGTPGIAGGSAGDAGGGGGGSGVTGGQGGPAAGVGGSGGNGADSTLAATFGAFGEGGLAGQDGGVALGVGAGGGGGAGGYGLIVVGTGNLGAQDADREGGRGGAGGFGDAGGGGGGSGGVGLFIGASAPNAPLTGVVNANITGGQGGDGGSSFTFSGRGGNGGSGIVFGNNTVGFFNGLPNAAPVSLTINGNVSGGAGGAGGSSSDPFLPPARAGQGGAGIVANGEVTLVLNGSVSGGLSGSNRADALLFAGGDNTVTFGANYTQQGGVNVASGQLTILQNQNFTIAPNTSGNIFGNDINAIFGDGALRFTGTGTTTLTAENFYTGGTTISNGNVAISNSEALGTGFISFSGSGSLRATNSLTLDEQIGISPFSGITTLSAATGTSLSLTGGLQIQDGLIGFLPASPDFAENVITPRTVVFGSATDTGTVSLDGSSFVFGGGFELRVEGGTLTGNSRRLSALTSIAAAVDIESGATLEYRGIETGQGIQFLIGAGNLVINGAPPDAARLADDGAANGPAPSQTGSQLSISQGDFGGVISGVGSLRIGAITQPVSLDASTRARDPSFAENDSSALIVRLTGANTYTGTTTIDEGRELILGNGGTTGSIGAGNVINDGSLAFERSDTVTFANTISGVGQLFQVSPGTLILTGDNTYAGPTTIFAGSTLQAGAGGTSGTVGTGAVTNNGTFAVNRSNAVTLANVISGTGAFQQNGTGTTTLTGANTYTGATTIAAGTLQLGNGGATGSITTAEITNNGTFAVNRSDAVTLATVISGTGAFQQNGSGATTLTGANTYAGATTIAAGTLQLGDGGTTGSIGAGAITNNGTLAVNRSNAVTLANAISGTGAFQQLGAGATTLTGANTYAGATTISAGTLQIGAGGTSGALGTGAVTNNGTLAVNRSDAVTLANVISGTGAFQQNGSGTTTLTGANTYAGGSAVNAGTLAVSNLAALGTGAVSVASGGTLQVTNAADATFGLGLSGAGTLRKLGAGILTFASPASIGSLAVDAGVARINTTLTGSVAVANGARVDGSGTIAGSVTNAGTLAPGVGLGGLTITGNYTQAAGGVLEIDYSAAGANIDLLTVNGSATLAGGVRFVANDASEASGGTFLRATGGVTGTFSNVEVVGTSGAISVVYDPSTGSITAPAPIIATTRSTTLVSQLDAQKLLLRSVYGTLLPGGVDGLDFGVEPGTRPARRFWADGVGTTIGREARGDALGFDVDVYGTTFGGEFATGVRGLSVGGFASYLQTDIDLSEGAGDGEQRGILGGAFVDWTHKATALRAGFVIGRIDQSTNRVVTFNGVDETLEGDTDSNARSIFANVGQRFGRIAGWSVSGHLSSVYTRLRQDAYVEQGDNPLAVAAPALGQEQWTGDLRLQTSRVLGGGDGNGPVLLRFAAGVSRTEEFGDRLVPITLTNLGTEQLLAISTREDTVGLFDAGVRWRFTKLSELRLNYQGRYGSDTSHAVQGGISFRF